MIEYSCVKSEIKIILRRPGIEPVSTDWKGANAHHSITPTLIIICTNDDQFCMFKEYVHIFFFNRNNEDLESYISLKIEYARQLGIPFFVKFYADYRNFSEKTALSRNSTLKTKFRLA